VPGHQLNALATPRGPGARIAARDAERSFGRHSSHGSGATRRILETARQYMSADSAVRGK